MKRMIIICLLLAFGPATAAAQSRLPKALEGTGFDQRLDQQVPLELRFRDEAGDEVRLADYFRGRPVILVLVYYQCPMLCNLVLNGLTQTMSELPFDAGKEFEVVTVSFDPRETSALAAAKKRTYLSRYGREGAAAGWHFLTGQQQSIDRLAASVGFRYRYDPQRDQFAHASGIVLLTPTGRVSRYFFDVKYSPRDVRLGLVEASQNQIGSPLDQVLLFCFHYDPTQGKYGAAVMRMVRVGGAITMLVVGLGLWWLFRGGPRTALPVAAPGSANAVSWPASAHAATAEQGGVR
jgi:protein SCO1/2